MDKIKYSIILFSDQVQYLSIHIRLRLEPNGTYILDWDIGRDRETWLSWIFHDSGRKYVKRYQRSLHNNENNNPTTKLEMIYNYIKQYYPTTISMNELHLISKWFWRPGKSGSTHLKLSSSE